MILFLIRMCVACEMGAMPKISLTNVSAQFFYENDIHHIYTAIP